MVGFVDNRPMISVIVPVYKTEQYLNQCVDSILSQTYNNLEIILVDDGSPDNCPQMCDDYARRDQRVKVIHKENGGISSARNRALDICTGAYIAFVDSDDWIQMNMLERLMHKINEKNVDAAFCMANIIVGDHIAETRFGYFPDNTIITSEQMVALTLKDEIGGQMCLRLMSRECWEQVRFPEGRIYEDLAISYKPFLYSKKGAVFLQEALYNYRMNPNGISLGYNPQKNYDVFLAFRDHYDYARKHVRSVENVCLGKTASFAMGYCNNSICFHTGGTEDSKQEAEQWLREHRVDILKCRDISLSRKLMILGYLQSSKLYGLLYRLILRMRSN